MANLCFTEDEEGGYQMIHLFRALGKPMVLMCAAYALDELAYDALLYGEEHPQALDNEITLALAKNIRRKKRKRR